MKRFLWKVLGFCSLGMAYLGVVLPGLPYSIFVVGAAYCFAKGSPKMEAWLYNHKLFGPFLTNWGQKRIFPQKMKYFMIAMMSTSLFIMYTTNVKPIGIISTAAVMVIVALWAWRFPGSVEEWEQRKTKGERSIWLK
jgi:uncharacterized membrane protein YbaN (DUF454 family)